MNERQINAVFGEIQEQRNIMSARCTEYVAKIVEFQEMIEAKDKRLAELEAELKKWTTPAEAPDMPVAPPPTQEQIEDARETV